MRHYIIALLLVVSQVVSISAHSEERPYWVKGAPHNELNFVGIGSANKSEANYQELASQRALRALASQIRVDISAESVLNTVENNQNIVQVFEENIKTTVSENIERHRLIESWQNSSEYWVYYELNRFDYEETVQARKEKAISTALNYWMKGNNALSLGRVADGVELYIMGLSSLSNVLNEDLRCNYNGKVINISVELYNSIKTAWRGVSIVTNPTQVEVQHLAGVSTPVAVGCYNNGVAMPQVSLSAEFITGAGSLGELAQTDANGVTALYINNINSKDQVQQVKISIENNQPKSNNQWTKMLINSIVLPSTIVTLNMTSGETTAYIEEGAMALPTLTNSIKSIVASKYFSIVSSPNSADVIIKISSSYSVGGEIKGDLYNTREYIGGVTIDFINNRTGATISSYTLTDIKTLLAVNKPESQGKQSVSREILKRINRELPGVLSKVTVDKSGDIPQISSQPKAPVATPIPTLSPTSTPSTPTPAKEEVKGQLVSDVWVVYNGFEIINDEAIISLTVINTRDEEYSLYENINSFISIYNEKGAKVELKSVSLGSSSSTYLLRSTLVSGIPTDMKIKCKKLNSIALLQIGQLKFRSLK